MNGWLEMAVVAAAIGAAAGYLLLRWLRARRRAAGKLCAGGCGCSFAAKDHGAGGDPPADPGN